CLNCTMPALVKSRLGSLSGISGALGTIVCPRARKKSRNDCRIWSPVTAILLPAPDRRSNQGAARGRPSPAVPRGPRPLHATTRLHGPAHGEREAHGTA